MKETENTTGNAAGKGTVCGILEPLLGKRGRRGRRTLLCFLLVVCLLATGGCARSDAGDDGEPPVYTVTENGVTYVIDTGKQTISDGTTECSYTFSGTKSDYTASITYPDGACFSWEKKTGEDGIVHSYGRRNREDEDAAMRAFEAEDMCDLIAAHQPKRSRFFGENTLPALVFLVMGLIAALFPEAVWYLEVGWKVRDGKPSDLALKANVGIGILMIVVAVVLFFT